MCFFFLGLMTTGGGRMGIGEMRGYGTTPLHPSASLAVEEDIANNSAQEPRESTKQVKKERHTPGKIYSESEKRKHKRTRQKYVFYSWWDNPVSLAFVPSTHRMLIFDLMEFTDRWLL